MHLLIAFFSILFVCGSNALRAEHAQLTFACEESNDLYVALQQGGQHYPRFERAEEAIRNAKTSSGVLILADGYPTQRTILRNSDLELAATKSLRLYIEFPEELPGISLGKSREAVWERGVVTGSFFSPKLPDLSLVGLHQCIYLPVQSPNTSLSLARVAGYDNAVFGLPPNAVSLLFEVPERKWIVATTKLSNFVTARYAPSESWTVIWDAILERLAPGTENRLKPRSVAHAAYSSTLPLPDDAERSALNSAARWVLNSRLLVPASRVTEIATLLRHNKEVTPIPAHGVPAGDGSHGILEGYSSGILPDGTQQQRTPLRADCNAESAMVLAMNAALSPDNGGVKVAENLLDFVYFNSGLCKGARADPKHGAYGLIGWGDISAPWLVANYGDDNGRTLLATITAAAALNNVKWDLAVIRGLLGNFRTTGKLGFRGDRIDNPALEQHGWKHFRDSDVINISPHFEAALWTCYLWAYQQTGYTPFLEKTRTAINLTMKGYPGGWRWQDNMERARMLHCLAWLVRVDDTSQHRQWLRLIGQDLIKRQEPNGAIREWLGGSGGGHYQIPQTNESYGVGETPLIQQNGDPASDQLYTSGFALLALHEAAAATGDPDLKKAEDKLAEFLCRTQIRSEKLPFLDGWWFRAFDDKRWECWASSADIGWGAWSLEAGWAQAWGAAVFALRQKETSLWELTGSTRFKVVFDELKGEMLEETKN
jgi:hypothetical protein